VFRSGYSKILIVLLVFLFISSANCFCQNKKNIDSLVKLISTSKQDTNTIQAYLKLSNEYTDNNPQKGLQLSEKALTLAYRTGNKKWIANCFNNVGLYNRRIGNYSEAVKCYQKALKIYVEIGNIKKEGNCYLNLGTLYGNQGNYQLALEYFQKSLAIGEKNGDKNIIAFCLNNIGNIHLSLKNYSQALEYYQKALRINEELNNKNGMSICFSNMGAIYGARENHSKEIEFYFKALKIDEELEDKNGLSSDYSNIGNAYIIQGNFSKSMEYNQKALKISEELGDKNGTCWILCSMAKLNIKLDKYNEAVDYATKSLLISKEISDLEVEKLAYQYLSLSFEKLKNPAKALEYYKLFTITQDSILNTEKNKQITEMEARYQTGKKQHEIELLEKDKNLKAIDIKRQMTQIYALACGFILMIVLSLVVFRNYRNKKKANILLAQQKNVIAEKNEELNQQNNEIKTQRDELEENLKYTQKLQEALKHDLSHYMQLSLRKIINPHFIFNSLNSIQSFILQNEKLEASMYLSKFSDLMRKVLDQSQKEYITLKDEVDTLELYVELESKRFEGRFAWEINLDDNIIPEKVLIPPLISQPFIENAIWHGLIPLEKEGKLTITFKKNDDFLVCTIEDNGVGREKSELLNKNRRKRESHGIKITQERLNIINSLNNNDLSLKYYDLKNKDGVGIGTKVEFCLPLNQMISDD